MNQLELKDIQALFAVLRRHLPTLYKALAVAAVLATFVLLTAPVRYTVSALVVMQDPKGAGTLPIEPSTPGVDGQRQRVVEQVGTLEAWLKSEHVLSGLLPLFFSRDELYSPRQREGKLQMLRGAIELSAVGNYSIEFKYSDTKPEGMAQALEAVVARVLEGLTMPEEDIMSAHQFVLLRRREALDAARNQYFDGLRQQGIERFQELQTLVTQLDEMKKARNQSARNADTLLQRATTNWSSLYSTPIAPERVDQALSEVATDIDTSEKRVPMDARQLEQLRQMLARLKNIKTILQESLNQREIVVELDKKISAHEASISKDPRALREIEDRHTDWRRAEREFKEYQERFRDNRGGNYLGLFSAPQNVVLMGRPRDPLVGKSTGPKYAVAIMLLGFLAGLGMIALRHILDETLRDENDVTNVSGLPVLAAISIPGSGTRTTNLVPAE